MSVASDLTESANNLQNEMVDLSLAAKVLYLKRGELDRAITASIRIIDILSSNRVLDSKLITQLKDLAALVDCATRLFAYINGLDVDKHSNYASSVMSYLEEMEREAAE